MRTLIVASHNSGHFAPFIVEQAESLKTLGCETDCYAVEGKGFRGYLKNLGALKERIKAFCPDVVHAHYGLCGLLSGLQRQVPVVVTYHGSDINEPEVRQLSKLAMRLAAWNVFVSQKTVEIARPKGKFSLIPCGVDLTDLQLTAKTEARQRMRLSENKRYILFSGAFDNAVKNATLAKEAVALLNDEKPELLELKGYSREEVTLLLCSADALLMTSHTEGSPQVVKEAMACGCPVVSVDVGDVKERVGVVEGCFVAPTREPQVIADLLQKAMAFEGRTLGREKLIADGLDNGHVAEKLMEIYREICLK